jgi:hypothetical protein
VMVAQWIHFAALRRSSSSSSNSTLSKPPTRSLKRRCTSIQSLNTSNSFRT